MGSTVLKATTTQDEVPDPERPTFAMQFTSSPRGARLARRLAVKRMDQWGYPPASDTSCTVSLLVGELTTNAVCHGRVPGRDFQLRLSLDAGTRTVRIEVSDASPERPPACRTAPGPDDESGRGLLLVDILAARWGISPRHPVGKTVWADVETAPSWLR
ncbi:MAG: ATP-binding protein [Streptomyces sp.]|uniref:ATP-binding protein n=1 Tax=Streptomyces sp. TaxID=1931 RepID=UPI003D6ABAFC